MFYCLVGAKGGGKSYGALEMIKDELRLTDRLIMTNLPINFGRLQRWVDSQGWSKVVDVAMRIVRLTDQQVTEWFLWHRGGRIAKFQTVARAGEGTLEADYSERAGDGGIFFVIDEAHIPFPSDKWAAVARQCSFYATQERKLLDDTVFCTQCPDQLAKPLRQLMQEWVESRNMNKEPILGLRFPRRFRWRATLRQPDGREQTAISHRIVKMDVELAGCYDTLAGVGIVGRGDPNQERGARGIRWQIGLMLACMAILCVILGVWFGGRWGFLAVQKGVVGMVGLDIKDGKVSSSIVEATGFGVVAPEIKTAMEQGLGNVRGEVQRVSSPSFASNETMRVIQGRVVMGSSASLEPVTVNGWRLQGNRVTVYLSDGRVITERDPKLRHVGKDGVDYGDEHFNMSRAVYSDSRSRLDSPAFNPSPQLSRQLKVGNRTLVPGGPGPVAEDGP